MKSIKIEAKNAVAISAALAAVNGTATQHTYSAAQEIIDLAAHAETLVVKIVGTKKNAPGAIYRTTSGGHVANAYKYARTATEVAITRQSTAWYLSSVKRVGIYTAPPSDQLTLTAEQDVAAIANCKKQYFVAIPV